MSDTGVLEDLVRAGLLQTKLPDPRRVRAWLQRSRQDLDVVALLADVDRQRAMAVAYEAGFRACAGIIDLGGHRVTSQPGHHRAAITSNPAFHCVVNSSRVTPSEPGRPDSSSKLVDTAADGARVGSGVGDGEGGDAVIEGACVGSGVT
jgi:hypothetical protein